MKRSYSCAMALGMLIGGAMLHYERSIDHRLQNIFYSKGRWLVDQNEPVARAFFYEGPKIGLVLFALFTCVRAASLWRNGQSAPSLQRLRLLACLALIPALAALGKKLTNEPCPFDLALFGGPQLYPEGGVCFPAGHAAGGFALLALYWFHGERRAWLFPGLFVGIAMGAYQMAKGAHFLSDTLTTAGLAWLICLVFFPGPSPRSE